jgi:O-antigen/teichoic acid export membrane protein
MAAWNVAGWFATAAYGFAVTRLVVRLGGADAYGLWATVGALRGFIFLLDGGLAVGVNRDAALAVSGDAAASSRIRVAWRVYAGLAVAALVLAALAAGFPGTLLDLEGRDAAAARALTLAVGVEAAAALAGSPVYAILRGRQRFGALAVAAWAQAVLGIGLLLVLVPWMGVVGAAWAALASRAAVLAGTAAWMRVAGLLPVVGGAQRRGVRAVLAFAAPLWIVAAGSQFGSGTDVPVVGAFHGAVTAGDYALGAAMPGVSAGLLFAIMGASFPRMIATQEGDERRVIGALLFMATFLAVLGFGFIAFHAESLLRVWVGRASATSLLVAAICSLNWALNAPAHVLSSMAIARGVHRVLGPIVAVETLLNVALSIWLTSRGSPAGPALGTFVMVFVSNLVVVPIVLRPRLGLSWAALARPCALGAGLGLAGAVLVFGAVGAVAGGPLVSTAVGVASTLVLGAAVLDLTVRRASLLRGGRPSVPVWLGRG